jgi:hypothetical protein
MKRRQIAAILGMLLPCPLLSCGGAETTAPPHAAMNLVPLTETGSYDKNGTAYERGLYPGGAGTIPETHRKAGERIARSIVPLSSAGIPDPQGGKIVLLSEGHSNPRDYFNAFKRLLNEKKAEGGVNSRLELRNVCMGGQTTQLIVEKVKRGKLQFASPDVQVAFLLTTSHPAYRRGMGQIPKDIAELPFPQKMQRMKQDLKQIVRAMAQACPNLKMVFLTSDVWRGNSGLEPEVYEEGFAVKWLIEDQLRGDPELAFEGKDRKAPWLAWGPYLWEPDPPRDRFVADGVHASPQGAAVVVNLWLEFLSTDSTTRPWFLSR